MTKSFSSVYHIRKTGSGQFQQLGQIYLSPGPDSYREAKIAPWCLARRDSFSAKVPGLVSADGATNAYCPYQRAVSGQVYAIQHILLIDLKQLNSIRYEIL